MGFYSTHISAKFTAHKALVCTNCNKTNTVRNQSQNKFTKHIFCVIFNPNEINSGLIVQASHYFSTQPPP